MHWPLLTQALEGILNSLHSAHLQHISLDVRMSVDALLRLGPFPGSQDPTPIHKAQTSDALARVPELAVHLSVVPSESPPVRRTPSSMQESVEDTAAAGFRTLFAPFHARGALRVSTEVYDGEPTSRFYSGASSMAVSVEDVLSSAGSVGSGASVA